MHLPLVDMNSLALLLCGVLTATAATAQSLPPGSVLSQPGPSFSVAQTEVPNPLTFIAYGDQRFTDPLNHEATDPKVRKWLVEQIALQKPEAIILNGDVPLAGNVKNDYVVFHDETKAWREARLRVYPALGNHEFHGDPKECLENWWTAFPEMRNRRWYSVQLGDRVYVIALDSDTSLLPGSDQAKWLTQQIDGLASTTDFVLITMHHPPVADVQTHLEISHNPRPNEIALRDYLTVAAQHSHAKFIVSAGHIHNYERTLYKDVMYLVSGGGGARPYYVERTPEDLYQSRMFPNYHYVKFTLEGATLHGAMYRVINPESDTLAAEVKDQFDVTAKSR